MSERGAFVTEFIYCPECLNVAKKYLVKSEKYLCGAALPSWNGDTLPIIAGKIGGLYTGDELDSMKEVAAEMQKELCHAMRIAVICDGQGEEFIAVKGSPCR